jgi:hypothetical protein
MRPKPTLHIGRTSFTERELQRRVRELESRVTRLVAQVDELRQGAAKPRTFSEAAEAKLVPWPDDQPPKYNACKDPCDMWTGPCCCGAWHKAGV